MPPISGRPVSKPALVKKPPQNANVAFLEPLYPKVEVRVHNDDYGGALTVEQAKELLGWESETKTVLFGEDYLFTDALGKKIRCSNNTRNRPLNDEWCRTLAQDILNRKWKFNCETIIIGKSGQILSGQHRLIALVLAGQLWASKKEYQSYWETEPTLETLIALGAHEEDEYTQTLDNVRPRTLADTLYTSQLFKEWKPRDKKVVVRVADYAVRLAWDRTGMAASSTMGRMTNSEAYDFLQRHLRLLEMVKHVYVEDHTNKIRECISLGYAATLAYLMAASNDSREEYESNQPPNESTLKFELWSKAETFWVQFGIGAKKFDELRKLMVAIDPETEMRVSVPSRIGMIVKGWHAQLNGEPMDEAHIDLCYDVDAAGNRTPAESPVLGGIDVEAAGEESNDGERESETTFGGFRKPGGVADPNRETKKAVGSSDGSVQNFYSYRGVPKPPSPSPGPSGRTK